MSTVEHRFIETNGIRLHIAEQGSGPLVSFTTANQRQAGIWAPAGESVRDGSLYEELEPSISEHDLAMIAAGFSREDAWTTSSAMAISQASVAES